jgi:hypothetical protein
MEKLKPCPFCGSSAKTLHGENESLYPLGVTSIVCEKCFRADDGYRPEHFVGVYVSNDKFKNPMAVAARLWNRRADKEAK